jgi:hypothetical protein
VYISLSYVRVDFSLGSDGIFVCIPICSVFVAFSDIFYSVDGLVIIFLSITSGLSVESTSLLLQFVNN